MLALFTSEVKFCLEISTRSNKRLKSCQLRLHTFASLITRLRQHYHNKTSTLR